LESPLRRQAGALVSEAVPAARPYRTPPATRHRNLFSSDHHLFPYLLWVPTILVLLLMVIYPTIYLLRTSLYRINPMALGLTQFVGLGNFTDALTRREFWNVLGITGIYAGVSLALEFILGIGLALLVTNHIKRWQGLFKVLLIAPMMMTPVAVGLVWRWMFDATMGVINYFLGLGGIAGPVWLGGESTALAAVITVEVWQWTPFVFLCVLAGLSALPHEPFEAARVDGANSRQIFTQITVPLLLPVLSVVLVFRFIDVFKSFDIIYVMTEGGPGQATSILPFYIYQQGFRYFNTGFAAAISILLLITVIVIYSWMLRRFVKL
jgi:multiple sugar transport system permease protein